jgi:hypothetical protein
LSGEGRILGTDLEMDHAISTVGPSQLGARHERLQGGDDSLRGLQCDVQLAVIDRLGQGRFVEMDRGPW